MIRPLIVDPPAHMAPLLEDAGYWPLHLDCEGEPDPGRVTIWLPGEVLEDLVSGAGALARALGEAAEIRMDLLQRAAAEYRAEQDAKRSRGNN